jgi:transposase
MTSEIRSLKRDLDALESRRFRALDLLRKGFTVTEAAREVGVARQTVNRWMKTEQSAGIQGLRRAARAGRKPRLTEEDMRRLRELLQTHPRSHGFAADRWAGSHVAQLIKKEFGTSYHVGHVWRLLAKARLRGRLVDSRSSSSLVKVAP